MEINQGYAIRRVIAFDNECGFALGENPKAPDPYVTWQFNMRDGERNYFWGHYCDDARLAESDLKNRAEDYQRRYYVERIEQPPEQETYKYYSTQRPIDVGTYPNSRFNGVVEMTIYPERWRVEGEAFRAWGEIDYAQPLLPCEVADYELHPSRHNPDIRREMDAQAQIVGAWEDAKRVPEQKRLTWFYGFQLEPTTIEGIRTKMMKPDPETADIAKLMFEMYSQPGISFGDIARYFADEGILIYGKEMKRGFISQLLRNPIYAQADLDMYEFFKSQGTVVVNEATDFAGTNGCYLYQGRDVQERKNKHLKDQILVLAPSEGLVSSDTWLRCRKKLMANKTFQGGRKAKNTWLAGKVKCGRCGYALMSVGNPTGVQYLRCSKRADSKSCDGCGTLRTREFERFLYGEMVKKLSEFQTLTAKRETVNPKLTALNMELARVEDEIEKLLNTLTGANAVLLSYANSKIEELDTRRQALTKEIAALSAETMSPEQIERLSVYLNQWEEIDFEDRRQVADGLISQIRATDEHVSIEWKI